jgi:hypothetical protein
MGLPALDGGLKPISASAQTNSGTIDMSKFNRAHFILSLGLGNAGGNAALQWTNNANGATATTITGGSLAYVANNSLYTFEARADQLPYNARYVKLNFIPDGAVIVSIVGEGHDPRHQPVTDNTSVVSRVASSA